MRRSFSGRLPRLVAALLGCDPARPGTGGSWPEPGSAVSGFGVVSVDEPRRLVISGRHRFSRYAIVLRVVPEGSESRCLLESRAAFPGLHGRLYRLAVIGSGGHRASVRRLLGRIRVEAEAAGTF